MNSFGLKFHHLGLAVRDREKAERFAKGLGYEVSDVVHDPLAKVRLSMCVSPDMPDLEIISYADEKGPLDAILKDASEMIYHTCYSSGCPSESVAKIKEAGFRVIPISPPTPAVLFDEAPVSFYYVAGFGLIEIVEE